MRLLFRILKLLNQQFSIMFNAYSKNRTRRTFSASETTEMQGVLRQMGAINPKSKSTMLAFYKLGQHDLQRGVSLEKAYKANVADVEIIKNMAIYSHLMGREKEKADFLRTLFSREIMSKYLGVFAKDVLLSCPKNAILIVHAEEDALASLYAQKIMNVRTDVQIISLDWLNSPQFRGNLKAKGFQLPKSTLINVSFLKEFCVLNADKKIAVSSTLPREYLQNIVNNLYLTGLVFRVSPNPIDVSDENKELYISKLHLELADNPNHPISANYLPFLLQLKTRE